MWEILLDRSSEIGMSRQLFLVFSERILSGQFSPEEALPSTRELARDLGVSRNTVNDAYAMLISEGFVVSRQGAPTRVAAGLALERPSGIGEKPERKSADRLPAVRYDFRTGRPDLTLFPWPLWSKTVARIADFLSADMMGYGGQQGYAPLRGEIAAWLLRSRGIDVDPGNVFITAGATQAMGLVVDVLYRDGLAFALENPSHPGVHTIAMKRYPYRWVPVDECGMEVESLQGDGIAAVYVTPSHQYPLGSILPAGRRSALVRMARTHGFYIIEDDYDSEFRYTGAPVTPLYSMDPSHVIYIGTFSKTLFPALRLGFAVLPEPLHAEWIRRRRHLDVQSPILEQAVLADFLHTRKMDRHVRMMRRVYREKRQVLLKVLEEVFGRDIRLWGDAAGLHVALQFPDRDFGGSFMRDSLAAGICIYPLKAYCAGENLHDDMLLLGYGHLSHVQIREGIAALGNFMLSTYSMHE